MDRIFPGCGNDKTNAQNTALQENSRLIEYYLNTGGKAKQLKIVINDVLQAISKKWIRVQGKARGGEKAQHTR